MEGILFCVNMTYFIWFYKAEIPWEYGKKIRLIGFALQTIKLKENCPQFLSKTDLLEFSYCKESNPLKIGDLRSNKII